MTAVEDSAPPRPGSTFQVGFGAPGRMSTFAAARGAARLARREVRRRPGRTLLVVALVAVPVMAMTLGVVLARTMAISHEEVMRRRMGGVADIWVSPGGYDTYPWGPTFTTSEPRDLPPPVVEDLVPEGSRTASFTTLSTSIIQAGVGAPASYATLSDLPLEDPVVGHQVQVRSGRAPRGPDEVLVSTSLADRFDVAVGDTLELAQPEGAWQVVGIGRRPVDWRVREVVFGAFDWSRVEPGHATTSVLVDLPEGTTAQDLSELTSRTSVVAADPALYEPPAWWGEGSWTRQGEVAPAALVWGWVAGALALVVVGIIVAAAFATSARRQLVTLGQLGAQGAPRTLVGVTLALQGSWSGLLGSLAGVGGALALLVAGRSLVDQVAGRSLGAYAVRPSDLVIIVLTGTVAGTVAALVPARSAARVPVLAALAGRRPLGRVPRFLVPTGLALFAGGMGLLAVAVAMGEAHTTQTNLMAAVAVLGGLGILFGTCCASPLAIDAAGRLGGRLRGAWRLAARSLGRQRTRSAGVVTAIAVSGAAALMVIVAVATATGGATPGPDGVHRYSLPSHPADLVEVSWSTVGMPSTADRPVPADLAADLATVVPGGELAPRRVAYLTSSPDPAPDPDPGPGPDGPPMVTTPATEETLPGLGAAPAFAAMPWQGWGEVLLVADPVVIEAVGLSDRDRATLEERGILVLWPPTTTLALIPPPGSQAEEGWPDQVDLTGFDGPLPVRQDRIDSRIGGTGALVDPAAAEGLGLTVAVDGGYWLAPGPLTEAQRGRLENLRAHRDGGSVFRTGPVEEPAPGSAPEPIDELGSTELGPHLDWRGEREEVSPLVIQAVAVAVALLFTLLVMAIGLSLSATESRDERDVLVAVGAPPRTLRRMAGIKALLLAATAMVLAVPTGLAPASLVISRITERSLVLPLPALGLLLLGVPVAAGVAAWWASALAQRVRPVRASTVARD